MFEIYGTRCGMVCYEGFCNPTAQGFFMGYDWIQILFFILLIISVGFNVYQYITSESVLRGGLE